MGINGLTPFLKKYAPNAFSTVSLALFSQKRIAIDISLFLYKYKVVFGEQWLSGVVQLLTTLRENAIHPIVVFDGEAPIEKIEEQKIRRATREERNNRYLSLMGQVDEYNATGVICDELQEFYTKSFANMQKRYSPTLLAVQMTPSTFDINFVLDKLSKMQSQNVRVTFQDIQMVQNLLNVLHIQSIQAPTEAEALCSWLTIKNIVDAVLTEDTDVLAYGSPLFLNKINTNTGTCTMIDYNKILDELQLTREQFTELCIMCGCDYNQRVKGVGPSRIFKLYKKYSCFDEIVANETKYDFTNIHMERIKQLFTSHMDETIDQINIEDWYSGTPNFTEIESFGKQCNFTVKPERIYNACLQDARSFSVYNKYNYKKRNSPSK